MVYTIKSIYAVSANKIIDACSISINKQKRRCSFSLIIHCKRYDDDIANKLVMLIPQRGKINRDIQSFTYIETLRKYCGRDGVRFNLIYFKDYLCQSNQASKVKTTNVTAVPEHKRK